MAKNIINTFEDVDKKLLELARHESFITKKEVAMNERIQSIKEKFDEETVEARAQKALIEGEIESFCRMNKFDFQKQRSKDLVHGSVGFRTNPPKVNQLSRKYTVKTSIEFLRKLFDGKYIRMKEEIDKEKILSDYAAEELDDKKLAGVGLRVDQDETFFTQINWETIKSDADAA